jgi:hypothetical protein
VCSFKLENLTGSLPDRLKAGLVLFPVAILASVLLGGLGLFSPGFMALAWFGGIAAVLACVLFVPIVWQLLSYRNPVMKLTEDALVFYGTVIPWSAIDCTYVGMANFTMIAAGYTDASLAQERLWIKIGDRDKLQVPAFSRRFMYRLARAGLRQSGGNLLLPLVKECSVEGLAHEIQEKIRR